jgi:membrane protein implicated in regulation of membrane protease activity
MNIDWTVTPASLWFLLGVLLILSEFAFPGIIAIFFGAAAIVVAIVLFLGIDLSLNLQILLFAALGAVLLLLTRNRLKRWFQGKSTTGQHGVDLLPVGTAVMASEDFVNGSGLVHYSGARWNAESDEPISAGQQVWTTGRRGLVLKVSTRAPESGQ